MDYFIGVDIGGTNTKLGAVSLSGEVLDCFSFPTQSKKGIINFTERLDSNIKDICERFKISPTAIGIGVPNIIPATGRLVSAVNLKWHDCDFQKLIRTKINHPHIYIQNDANIAAIGEKIWGGAKSCRDFVVVTLGTGLGTGIFCNNELLKGVDGQAAEAGHLHVQVNGRNCECGGKGHLESYASVKGIKLNVFEIIAENLSFAEIKKRFFSGDQEIIKAVDKTSYYLGLGLSQLQTMFLPEKIIIAGGVSSLGKQFLHMTQAHFEEFSFRSFQGKTQLELSKISLRDGAILGAAAYAIERVNHDLLKKSANLDNSF